MIVMFNADEIEHLETKRKNEDLSERDKADTKRYIEDQEALRWYNDELDKANERIEVLQKQLDEATEMENARLRIQEALEMEVDELRETVKALTRELEKQKKAREVWVRQAGMLTK